MKKRFIHICEEFEHMWWGKDNGQIPVYMGKLGYISEIWTNDLKNELVEKNRGVNIVRVPIFLPLLRNFASWTKFIKRFPLYLKLAKEAKEIDILMLFHMTKSSYWNAFIYKYFNPNGKVYIKADFDLGIYSREVSIVEGSPKNLRGFFKKKRYTSEYKKRRKLARIADLISYETKEAYKAVKDAYAGVSTVGKTMYLPNGFDSEELMNLGINDKTFEEKESCFITVGRLGTREKNTEMILEALDGLDLKGWKFYLVGPIEDSFKDIIDNFYKKNPDKIDNVIFTGKITDKKELYEAYNKSKVFVLTSRWESSAIVLAEAGIFNNFLLSTDVGAAKDISNNFKLSSKLNQEDSNGLSNEMKKIIEEKVNIEDRAQEVKDKLRVELDWKNLSVKLERKLNEK